MRPDSPPILDEANRLMDEMKTLRHAIHRRPEVGLHLPHTQRLVLDWLAPLPVEVSTGQALSSVIAVLRSSRPDIAALSLEERPMVLLRADMDGLPLTESTGLPFASEIPDAMHACGHDMHTAMLAGAARLLADRREDLAGDVVFMFQPGEEGYDGAGHMLSEGVLDAAGHRVDAAYALHVLSNVGPSGVFLSRSGPILSASDALVATILGAGGHGSTPVGAKDPVPAAAAIVTALQTMVTREFSAFDPVVLSVGVLQAGTARNIIPPTARIEATLRSFSAEARARLSHSVPRLIAGIASAHGLDASVELRSEYPVTMNDPRETEFAAETVLEYFGDAGYSEMEQPLGASEDFSKVLDLVPGSYVFLSALPEEAAPHEASFNHAPDVLFSDEVLPRGAALYAALAMHRLERGRSLSGDTPSAFSAAQERHCR